jgi:hypothetical protein
LQLFFALFSCRSVASRQSATSSCMDPWRIHVFSYGLFQPWASQQATKPFFPL